MDNFVKIKQTLALDNTLFLKIKENIYGAGFANGVRFKPKKFWLFAESLGEFRLALYIINIINDISERNSDKNKPLFFISFKTNSVYTLAKKILSQSADSNNIIYFFHPAGIFKKLSNLYVSAIKPDYFISIEHFVSNNLTRELLNINARMCFLDINPLFFKKIKALPVKHAQTIFITVSGEDNKIFLEKIISSSALDNPFRITVLPAPLKFNLNLGNGDNGKNTEVKRGSNKDLVISFVSIHKNESKFIFNMIKEIALDKDLNKNRNLKFIFAPRNIKISSKLFKIALNLNLKPAYLKNINDKDISAGFLKNNSFQSLIVNDYGSLDAIYPLSDIVYVGKSLYESEKGGHNILEPASFGKAVITGSYASNFRDIITPMVKNNAITIITEHDFKNTLYKLINDDKFRRDTGLNALKYYLEKRDKSKEALINYLSTNFI
ncbi:MAG: hypothetical protein M0016_02910 [Deltaproteobacteria bacterium]|jgi:3-deoxy-D-manno-octulosonic-acid transferase|nr:hypothetical protein [Deltaproteobacteria bacterium]MCL5879644.1 hypothetical protein [Deltaproteobacteria bacterium]MDA8304097.1 hypothetical protein [Deltaproteobacteria bacterium]